MRSVSGYECSAPRKPRSKRLRSGADDPTEDHRRATWAAAETAGFDTAASLLAPSPAGGCLLRPGVDPVLLAEGITAQMTAATLTIAATQAPPGQAIDRYRNFLEQGKKLALSQKPGT